MDLKREALQQLVERGGDCLPAARIEALFEGRGAEADRRHLDACLWCQNEAALFRTFVEASPDAGEKAAVAAIERRLRGRAWHGDERKPSWFPGWLTAASSMAAIVLAVFLVRTPSTPPAESEDVTRSVQIESMAPAGDVANAPESLRWSAVAGAVRYELRIVEVDGEVIWSASTPQAATALPVEARAKLLPGKAVSWEVRALDAEGRTISTGRQRIRVEVTR